VSDWTSRLNTFVKSVGEAIVILDEAGRIVMANEAAQAMWGHPEKEMVNKSLLVLLPSLFSSGQTPDLARYVSAARGTGVNRRIESSALHADGTKFPVELYIAPMDVAGQRFFTATIRDASQRFGSEKELRLAKEQAESANKTKSTFLATMSHEIRTPLNAVLGALTLLDDSQLDQRQRKILRIADDSAQALLDTINDILDFSKIEAGGIEIETVSFDIAQLLSSTVGSLGPRAATKGLRIATYLDPHVPRVLDGDPGRIRQILMNLLGNAIKFTARGGIAVSVELGARESDAGIPLRLIVEDTGIGIDDDALPQLFQEFTQVDRSYQRRFEGSGLGLAITQRIVAAMGGQISCSSKVGQGTVFSVAFTLTADLAATSQYLQTGFLESNNILLFEETPLVRETLAKQLRAWRLSVTTAEIPFETFVQHLAAEPNDSLPDIVIVDSELFFDNQQFIRHLDDINFIVLQPLGEINRDIPGRELPNVRVLSVPVKAMSLYRLLVELSGKAHHLYAGPDAEDELESTLNELAAPTGARLLLAEDSPANQFIAKEILNGAGYHVDVAINGIEAIEAAANFPYDVILMDIQMPEMDGFAATKSILELPSPASSTPIIAMTANATSKDREKCLASGMVDFIPKPVGRKSLLATILKYAAPRAADRDAAGGTRASHITRAPNLINSDTLARMRRNLDHSALKQGAHIFINELEMRLKEIARAAANLEYDKVGLHAHTIKSGAEAFGADTLGKLAAEIQSAAEAELYLDADKAIDALPALAHDVISALKAQLSL